MSIDSFLSPAAHDDGGYVRHSQELSFPAGKPLKFRTTVGGTGLITVVTKDASGERIVWQGDDNTYWNVPTKGNYVAKRTGVAPVDFNIYDTIGGPRGPFVAVIQSQMDPEEPAAGYDWIDVSNGIPLPKGSRIQPRIQVPWTTIPNGTTRAQWYMRPLMRSVGVWDAMKEWGEDWRGGLYTRYNQVYLRGGVQAPGLGNLRTGLYGVGDVGTPVNGVELPDGTLLIVGINAGLSLVYPDLEIERVWGWKIKDGQPAPVDIDGETNPPLTDRLELVGDMGTTGILPNSPWGVVLVKGKEDSECLVANTDSHQVLHYDFRKKKLLGVIGSPQGVQGRVDGPNALLRRPRGLCYHPDGRLFLSQAWNHSFGEIDLSTYSYIEKIRSVNNWDNYPTGNTLGSNFPYVASKVRVMATGTTTPWEMDGPAGVASFHHPQGIKCDRNGMVIAGNDHVRNLIEWNPDTNSVKVIARLPDGGWSGNIIDNATRGWQSIDVGSVGTEDVIAFADWDELYLFKRSDMSRHVVIVAPTHKGTRFGANYRSFVPGYPWMAMFRKTNNQVTALVWGDAGSTCLQEMSPMQPGDQDYDLMNNPTANTAFDQVITLARAAWHRPPPGGGLSAGARYGDLGFGQLDVGTQFQDWYGKEAEFRAWVSSKLPWLVPDLDNLWTYVKSSQLKPANPCQVLIDARDNAKAVLDAAEAALQTCLTNNA